MFRFINLKKSAVLNPSCFSKLKLRQISGKQSDLEKTVDAKNSEEDLADKKFANALSDAADKRSAQLKNEPFIKNLFTGKYIYEYFKFPEYDTNHKLNSLNKNYINPIQTYLNTVKFGDLIDKNGSFTSDALKNFQSLHLFSCSLPKEFNGESLDMTGVTKIIEQTGLYPSLAINLLYNNQIGARLILQHGTQQQKAAYLKRISSGELKIGFCYSELDNGVDEAVFNCTSKFNAELNGYVLNGTKSWVTLMDEKSDAVFIVISKTVINEEKFLNAFLVDKNTHGLNLKKQLTNFNGLNLYQVELNDVKIPAENLIGSNGSGHEIARKILESTRYLTGAICVGLAKNLFKKTTEYLIESRRFDKALTEFGIIKDRVSEIECQIYTMESMTYMTAGIVDSYETADVGCESALTKIYCTEALQQCVNNCLELLGMSAYSKLDEVQHRYLTDLSYLSALFNTNDYLRIFVATQGVIMAGMELSDGIIKLRNPLNFPGYVLAKIWSNYKLAKSVRKKAPEFLYLWEHVHPSLSEQAAILEQGAVRFMMAVQNCLVAHGTETVDYQYNLKSLANMAMHLYALNSVLARASRAYSIGLKMGSHELGLAHLQAWHSDAAIKKSYEEIVKSRDGTGAGNIINNVADNVFKLRQHAASHSTDRNY